MVKKERVDRGYMTSGEVKSHLKDLKTNNSKITFLRKVLKRGRSLSKGTKESIHENLGQLYYLELRSNPHNFYELKKGINDTDDLARFAEILERLGKNKHLSESGGSWPTKSFYEDAAEIREKLGDSNQVAKDLVLAAKRETTGEFTNYIRAGEIYENTGDIKKAKQCYKQALKVSFTGRNYDEAERKIRDLDHRTSRSDLSSRVSSIIAIVGIISGVFFLSPNVTGNVVGNMTNSTSNVLGTFLLFVGLIAGFFSLKR